MRRRPLALVAIPVVLLSMAGVGYAQHNQARPAATQIGFGPSHSASAKSYWGFYDSHKDQYVNTDVSSKSQASAWHINYAPVLSKALPTSTSPMYFVIGKQASGQLAIFGSEPGDANYSPLWQEYTVQFKSGVTPVVIKSDDDAFALQKKHKVTITATANVLNSPITKIVK